MYRYSCMPNGIVEIETARLANFIFLTLSPHIHRLRAGIPPSCDGSLDPRRIGGGGEGPIVPPGNIRRQGVNLETPQKEPCTNQSIARTYVP